MALGRLGRRRRRVPDRVANSSAARSSPTSARRRISKTTLGGLRQGSKVNLERALRLSDRLGGHMVTGHVDGIGKLLHAPPGGQLDDLPVPGARRTDGLHRREGLGRGRRHLAHGRPDPRRELRRGRRARHRGGHDAQGQADRRAGQRRGRRHGQVRQATSSTSTRGGDPSFDTKRRGLGDMLRDFADGK